MSKLQRGKVCDLNYLMLPDSWWKIRWRLFPTRNLKPTQFIFNLVIDFEKIKYLIIVLLTNLTWLNYLVYA